ncbi:MAG: GGDEF domain-containing protein [Chloroflexi bacterium]|nr:MAG: GGDEF domain-containing protein [Chloroflexota bacterium]
MKSVAKLLIVLAFVFSGQQITGKAVQPGNIPLSANQNHAPGSMVRFEHLTIQDGLSQNTGQTIIQDSRGFLWIGTQDGLNRYDGYTFTVFKHDAEDPASISNNNILTIAEDQDGYLWIGTSDGLNRFDPATETFTRYKNVPNDLNSLTHNTITCIFQDSDDTLWVGTLAGLERFNPGTNGFDHFRRLPDDPASLSSNVISVIFEDSRHQLWIGTGALGIPGSGLNRFNPSTGKVTRFQHSDLDPTSLGSNNISAIYEAPDGSFWIGTGGYNLTSNGLDLFNPRAGTAFHYLYDEEIQNTLSGNNIAALWGDASGTLWIATWSDGLNRMDFSSTGDFIRYHHDPYFSDSLSGDDVRSLFKDRSGVLWIGTSNQGINKLPASSGQFSLYRNNPSNPDSLGTNTVGAFSEDQYGYIWVGTWGSGLDRFDPRRGRFEHFRHNPADPSTLSSDLVMAVYADSQNVVWSGTLGGGLNRLELATGKITHYFHDPRDPTSLVDNNVAVIISDGRDGLWLGTYGGLSHYDPVTDTFTNYVNNYANNPTNLASLSENKVISLYLDEWENVLWVGTWGGGLNRLDLKDPFHTTPQLAPFRTYRYNSDDPNSISEDSVWSILESADGSLWLGTQSGLNRFDPQTQTFKRYTEKQGLPNESILGILKDNEGHLWLTTNNGLAKFDPRASKFTAYDVMDGLQSNEFNSNAYFQSLDGTMYVGGTNGFNAFHPEDIQPNPVPPQVAITKFEVFNESQVLDLSGKKSILLSYQQDFIAFEFAALDFRAPQKNRYAYMLEGFDKNWIQTDDRRYATYTNLPGGEYHFRVKASNGDGVWNAIGASIPIIVSPPVWETWWFRGLGVIALATLTTLGFRWRLSTIHAQKADLEEQVAIRTAELEHQIEQRERAEEALAEKAAQEAVTVERTRLARDLHDAVTQTLFSASLIAEVLPDIWVMSQPEGWKRLEELRQLTRGALAEMRTLLMELRPSALTEIPLPDLLRQLCESLIGRARLPIKLCVEGTRKLPPDLQICLYRITQEALNNVVKHAKATQALVTLQLNEKVTLSIADNGSGFDPARVPPDHLGLKIMCERAEALGADISIYSEPGEGTQICVSWGPPASTPPLLQSSPEYNVDNNEGTSEKG